MSLIVLTLRIFLLDNHSPTGLKISEHNGLTKTRYPHAGPD